MDRPALSDALKQRDRVLRAFVGSNGRLTGIPTKLTKRLVVLDLVAQSFEIGHRYYEVEVNQTLRQFHDDHAALRRYLVDNEFLERRDGVYWRVGGTAEWRLQTRVAKPLYALHVASTQKRRNQGAASTVKAVDLPDWT